MRDVHIPAGPLAPNQAVLATYPVSSANLAKFTIATVRYLKKLIAVEIAGYGEVRFNRETGRCTDRNLVYRFAITRQA